LRWADPDCSSSRSLDSSVLSFPQVADALVLVQSARHPRYLLYYAGMATLGSLVGCFVVYAAGRKGGEVFLRRRFKAAHVDRGFALYRRYGMLVVLVPALLPPPAPFKIFVLLSGAAGLNPADTVEAADQSLPERQS